MDERSGNLEAGPRRRVFLGVVLTGVLAVVASACSSSSSPSSSHVSSEQAKQIVLASVDTTESVNSAAVDVTVSITGTPSLGGLGSSSKALNLSITGHGLFDFTNKKGELTLNLPSLGSGKPATTFDIREIGTDLYLSSPSLSAIDGNKLWVHVNTSAYEQKLGQSDGPLGGFSTGDPSQVLGLLKNLTGNVTDVGTADINGTPTTEYQATIDLIGTGSSTSSTILSKQFAQALGLSNIPVDVWIDSAGRARQLKTSFSLFGLTVFALEGIGSFGTPVSVSAPPPDQTTDGTSLLNGGQLGNLLS